VIKVEHLTKRYANTIAVDDISFEVGEGEILGFLGPNGAGKTTTMRMLTCFMPATSGTATVAGHDIFNDSLKVRQNIGYMPENAPLYHDMRVTEYLKFRAKLKKVPRRDRKKRIADCMEMCGVTDVQRKLIGHLSKGYRQRVSLTEALLHEPKILILDEPTIGLDPNQIRQVRHLVKDLGDKHTVILSTHILPEVEIVCKRVIIIDKGKLVAMDTPQNLVSRLKGGATVNALVRGPAEEVEKSLGDLEGVTSVACAGSDEGDDVAKFTIEASEEADVRESVFKCVASKDWSLLELSKVSMTLEDIFVHITKQEEEGNAS